MSASVLPYFEIAQGESFKPIATLLTRAGAAYDLTAGGVSVVCRLIGPSGTITTRTKGVSGETSYPASGTDGRIQFLFGPDATLALEAGAYQGEVVYRETSATPDDVVVAATVRGRIFAPVTAPI